MHHPEPDPPVVLPPELHRRALAIFRRVLPPPRDGDADDTAGRDADAIEALASLRPVNIEEMLLAVQFVVADARGMDILGMVTEDPRDERRRMAVYASMMRQSRGARALLLRVQSARLKRDRPATTAVRRRARTARVRVQPAPRMVPVSGTESRATHNETPARQHLSATTRRIPSAPVSSLETISHLSGNETTMRPRDPALMAATRQTIPSAPVSQHETSTRSSGNETIVRPRDPAPATAIQPPIPPAPVYRHETISRLSGNETIVRPHDPAPATATRRTIPTAPVSHTETMTRLASTETVARRPDVLSASAVAWAAIPAATVSPDETSSRLSGNETPMRPPGTAPAIATSSPGHAPARSVPDPETIAQLTGNETTLRRSGPLFPAALAPEPRPPFALPAPKRAIGWTGTASGPAVSLKSALLASVDHVPTAIVPRYRHPGADALRRTASR